MKLKECQVSFQTNTRSIIKCFEQLIVEIEKQVIRRLDQTKDNISSQVDTLSQAIPKVIELNMNVALEVINAQVKQMIQGLLSYQKLS